MVTPQIEWRVLVLGEDPLARAGLAALLENQPQILILGHGTADSDLVSAYQADLLLIDLGWEAARSLGDLNVLASENLPILALIANPEDAALVTTALNRFDAYGLLLRERSAQQIASAAAAVLAGLLVIDPALRALFQEAEPGISPEREELTPREHDVLQLLAQGLTNKAIAHQLGITEHTIKFHVNAILSKLNAQSRTEAVSQALRHGWLPL